MTPRGSAHYPSILVLACWLAAPGAAHAEPDGPPLPPASPARSKSVGAPTPSTGVPALDPMQEAWPLFPPEAIPLPPLVPRSEAPELEQLDQLLDRLTEVEELRRQGSRGQVRGLLWFGASLGIGILGCWMAGSTDLSRPLTYSWPIGATVGSLVGLRLAWLGHQQVQQADAELQRLDHRLSDLQGGSAPPLVP